MIVSCVRRIQFCAGHRVLGHEGKCRNAHGHNYVAFIHATGGLDSVGRVIDFSVLKEKVGGWIEKNWDHGFIAFDKDGEITDALSLIAGQKVYYLPSNPTAENMAKFLMEICDQLLVNTGVTVTKVVIWETENCYAEASR